MVALLLPLWLGCVVKVGPPGGMPAPQTDVGPSPARFTEVERQIDLLLVDPPSVDTRDRLLAALELARAARRQPPEVQAEILRYLDQLLAVEGRSQPREAPRVVDGEAMVFAPLGAVRVEEIPDVDAPMPVAGAEGRGPDAPRPIDVSALLAEARAAIDRDEPAQALALVEECRGRPCWELVGAVYAEARDEWVEIERDRAAARYLSARNEPDPEARRQALTEVRDALQAIAARFPDAAQAADLARNIATVEKALLSGMVAGDDPAREDAP
jgi:hypothetical protein